MIEIVLVDDEEDWLDITKSLLDSMNLGFKIKKFKNVTEAFNYTLNDEDVDLIISDYLFPGDITGLDLYYKLLENNFTKNFILISNSRIPQDKIKEIVKEDLIYLPKSYLVVKNFFKKHLLESLVI